MAKIAVNGKDFEVALGSRLIDVLDEHGIFVPRFCYHKSLGVDGNCRMCMVEIEGQKRPQISCDTYVHDGMKVHTDTPAIKELRKDILELELINHPIDCPVCDQAGECKLQEYYMAEGLYDSQLEVSKNQKSKAIDIGSQVMLDQERCVLCIRCVRFMRDITKSAQLGVEKRSDGARIATFLNEPLSDPYSMNVVDLCPVGALTSKDFRFKKRVWFLKSVDVICQGCSRGCNLVADHEGNKYEKDRIYRFKPRYNEKVNGYFICDYGRLSYKDESENRLTSTGSLSTITGLLQAHKNMTMFLVSPMCSLEELNAITLFAKENEIAISGFSEGYYDKDFGDEFLKQEDKSSNRYGFKLFEIDETKEHFDELIESSSLLVSFLHKDAQSLKQNLNWIDFNTHESKAEVKVAISSYLQKSNHYINFDKIIQKSNQVLAKQSDVKDLEEVLSLMLETQIEFDIEKLRQKHGL